MVDATRISQVSKKLNSLSLRPDFDLKNRIENCELRYKNLETKFADYQECQLSRYNTLKDQLAKLYKTIQKENYESDAQLNAKLTKMEALQQEYAERVQHENQLRKESFKTLNRKIDSKSNDFKVELTNYVKTRQDNMDGLYDYIEVN